MGPSRQQATRFAARAFKRLGYLLLIEPLLRKAKGQMRDLVAQLRPSTVLEVGCGACTQAIALARLGIPVTAVDISDRMFPLVPRRLPAGLTMLQADGSSLPFADRSFDLALASLTLHEMTPEKRLPVLGEMIRVVKPAGTILLMDFHFEDGQPPGFAGRLIRLIERSAGREHHAHFRDFVAHGGVPALARAAGCPAAARRPILGDRGGIFELPVAASGSP